MNETHVLIGVVTAFTGVLAWIGVGMNAKLDRLPESLSALAEKLHTRINDHDRRITVVETKCEINHGHRRETDGE